MVIMFWQFSYTSGLIMQAKEQRTKDLGAEIITGAFKVGERGVPSLGESGRG